MSPAESAHFPRWHFFNQTTGVMSWLTTLDHKRIALMYFGAVVSALILGGLLALGIRLELFNPEPSLVDAQTYNRLFTLHGMVMVFLFMVPAIPAVFGNFFLPMMLGAKDVAFPRLNLASFYIYVTGALFTLWAIVHGGVDTGWTFYVPYSTTSVVAVAPVMLGIFIVGLSSILTGLNFIVTTHTLRAPGLNWGRLPLFVWNLYGTSIISVLATPVIGIVALLVAAEIIFGFGLFDPARGGDPVLFQHLFWFYSHPVVYVMVLPAMGVVSEVFATFCRRQIFGYKMLAVATLGIALVGFFVWGHHLFVAGQSTFDAGIFGVLSMLVGVFTAIKVFNWVMTLYKGAVDFTVPFALACFFLYFLIFGGMTGIALAVISLDVHWHDTYYVVAHFHFVMVGSVMMAFLAAVHYWFPKMFGRMYSERVALSAVAFIFIGFNLTFVPQFLLGNMGMPRRYHQYLPMFQSLNVASTMGAFILGLGMFLSLFALLWALKWGAVAGDNPFHSRGYEWNTASPPVQHNFHTPQVIVDGPHNYEGPPAAQPTAKVAHGVE
ncbi:MAG: cbb3-type cytochrome c oxidase subunit I [Myxococcaceae bacterium]|nr:cbb3-type cytochrome c oxidase subunit I [Myxococcaceae bacterium]